MALLNLQTTFSLPSPAGSAPASEPAAAATTRLTSMLSTVSAFAILASVVWQHRCYRTCKVHCRCSDYF